MQKIADLEQEVARGHSSTALLQEQLDAIKKTAEEQAAEKNKVFILILDRKSRVVSEERMIPFLPVWKRDQRRKKLRRTEV